MYAFIEYDILFIGESQKKKDESLQLTKYMPFLLFNPSNCNSRVFIAPPATQHLFYFIGTLKYKHTIQWGWNSKYPAQISKNEKILQAFWDFCRSWILILFLNC